MYDRDATYSLTGVVLNNEGNPVGHEIKRNVSLKRENVSRWGTTIDAILGQVSTSVSAAEIPLISRKFEVEVDPSLKVFEEIDSLKSSVLHVYGLYRDEQYPVPFERKKKKKKRGNE